MIIFWHNNFCGHVIIFETSFFLETFFLTNYSFLRNIFFDKSYSCDTFSFSDAFFLFWRMSHVCVDSSGEALKYCTVFSFDIHVSFEPTRQKRYRYQKRQPHRIWAFLHLSEEKHRPCVKIEKCDNFSLSTRHVTLNDALSFDMTCSVLQCVAVCCSVLPCVAVCCSVLQCVAVCCGALQCVAVCCSVLLLLLQILS